MGSEMCIRDRVCGGSRKLLKTLNRVGATCSADTHDQFVTSIAGMQRKTTVWDDLSSDVFTVVSADNFDLLQSHAGMYCGDQHGSYHCSTKSSNSHTYFKGITVRHLAFIFTK